MVCTHTPGLRRQPAAATAGARPAPHHPVDLLKIKRDAQPPQSLAAAHGLGSWKGRKRGMQAQSVAPSLDATRRAQEIATPDNRPNDVASLLDHIIERYHGTHLRELPVVIRLAQEVEDLYAGDPKCPIGLADFLAVLAGELEAHQWREEATLFPLIRIGTPICLNLVTQRMMDDHVDLDVRLMGLGRFNHSFRPSFEAPFRWQALSFMCRKLERDLREHARLEHQVLYALLARETFSVG